VKLREAEAEEAAPKALQAPRRTAPEEDTEERGEEMPLLMWTLAAAETASLEPILLVSSRSEDGMRILADLGCGDVEEDGVVVWSAAGTESEDEVCADWEEEEPDETWTAPSGCSLDCESAVADEPEGSDGEEAVAAMGPMGSAEGARICAARCLLIERARKGCG
jgi:hypothetical protein